MKHSLMHISSQLIRFHEVDVNYVKWNASQTAVSKINSKKCKVFNLLLIEYVFSKNTTKQKTKRKRSVKVKHW